MENIKKLGNQAEKFTKVFNRIVEAFDLENYAGIRSDFSKIMLDNFPLEQATKFFKELFTQYGKIKKFDSPKIDLLNDTAIFPTHFERGKLNIKIVLDRQDKIAGLEFLPYTPSIPIPKEHKTELSLPFKGQWLVSWGGDTEELNQHHDIPNQRYAFDFVIVDEHGKTFKGDGTKNEDYYAFGKEVLAPASGVVTDVIEGVRDNLPGAMNPYSALGNTVFIQHQKHEVSILAHLKLGSTKVKVGDKVKKGQVIGLCGNSGNSSEPHLHYHLQNTPIIQDGVSIKCYFQKVVVIKDGKKELKIRYSPIKGEIVSQE